jgi:5-methylcytosine-specific restriction endonuclease McrA
MKVMIKIPVHKNSKFTVTKTVEENPTPGTIGNLILLKEEYKKLDESWGFDTDRFEKMMFNVKFLESMLEKHGELHCEYCGKPHLKIIHWKDKQVNSIMATADHYYPASEYPSLARVVANLRVSCFKCNNDKKTELWECKFPYPEHKNI